MAKASRLWQTVVDSICPWRGDRPIEVSTPLLKETLGFMSTETIKAYYTILGTGMLGGQEFFISNTYSLHCHHQNDSALRWAVVRAILMFH